MALLLYETVLRHPVSYIARCFDTRGRDLPDRAAVREELALGYVTARLFESTFILVGIVSMLGIITLRQQATGGRKARSP